MNTPAKCHVDNTSLVEQVKSNLIRQREVDILVPAAGPGASDVLHLLRPAAAPMVQPALVTGASASILQSAEITSTPPPSKPAAPAVFKAKPSFAARGVADTLLRMSCAIGAGGEV